MKSLIVMSPVHCLWHRATMVMGASFVLLLFLSLGCNRGSQHVPVTGKVIYQGEPLTFGSVMFQPEGAAEPSRGDIQADGTFTLATQDGVIGVAVGRSRVRVTAFEGQRQMVQGSEEPTLGKSVIPSKFQSFGASGIEVDVTPEMALPVVIDLDQFVDN